MEVSTVSFVEAVAAMTVGQDACPFAHAPLRCRIEDGILKVKRSASSRWIVSRLDPIWMALSRWVILEPEEGK